jgi:membrane protease YdiL (CAAX protease family)
MAVVLAPILEECIFRAPISLFKNKQKYFKYIFYGFALLFGFVHIFNYEITPEILLFSPLLVAPQISLGLLLGYLRVKLSLIYSITLHMLFNASLLIPFLLIMP